MAARFGIATASAIDPTQWQVLRSANRWSLRAPADCGALTLELSVQTGPMAQRLRTARRTDALPRACGLLRSKAPLHIVDATAGLGRDAMVLAALGCTVTAIERLPALALLLHLAIADSALAEHLTVVLADAADWLRNPGTAPPQVVYLDPMFATAGKAQVKKDMQVCRLLAGAPDDPAALLVAARAAATLRVVVKRHHGEAAIAPDVSFAVAGERVRFDVYLAAPSPR